MGLSSSKTKTKQTNKPVYESEISGAHDVLTNTYNQQQPKVQGYADQIGGLTDDLISKYQAGNPAVNAAQDYVTETLQGDGSNPHLQDMIDRTGDSVQRRIQTQLGTRGGIGGSAEVDILGRALSDSELNLRYNDYGAEQSRRAQAAGMAPGVAAGDLMTLAPALATAEFGATLPMDMASRYAAGTGGLLGQYQDVNGTQKQSGGFAAGLLGAGLSGWASGGFKI